MAEQIRPGQFQPCAQIAVGAVAVDEEGAGGCVVAVFGGDQGPVRRVGAWDVDGADVGFPCVLQAQGAPCVEHGFRVGAGWEDCYGGGDGVGAGKADGAAAGWQGFRAGQAGAAGGGGRQGDGGGGGFGADEGGEADHDDCGGRDGQCGADGACECGGWFAFDRGGARTGARAVLAEGQAEQDQDEQHDREKYVAVEHVVGRPRLGAAEQMAEQHDAQRAKPVRHHRHRDADDDEGEAPSGRAEDQQGVEHAEGDGGDQEAQAGAGFGDVEGALGDLDRVAMGIVGDAEQIEPEIDEIGGELLQRRDQEAAERDQEHQIEQGGDHRAIHAPAEHAEDERLHHAHRRELPAFHDAQPIRCQPHDGEGECETNRARIWRGG